MNRTTRTMEVFQVQTNETISINPAPLNSTLVPGMELTIPSAEVDRKFLVSAQVAYGCGENAASGTLLQNGAMVTDDLVGIPSAASASGSLVVAGIVIKVAARAETVLQLRWRFWPGERARLAKNHNFPIGVAGRHICAVQVA